MQLPFFYIGSIDSSVKSIILDEETSRHVVQVLRMKKGEKLNLTDGKGNLLTAEIILDHKKHCEVKVIDSRLLQRLRQSALGGGRRTPDSRLITIAISLLKNTTRFEWFLEKVTEIGVSQIIPLICERTEKQKFRFERMQQICISAMLQSQQCWLPVLHKPVAYELLFRQVEIANADQKFIAYCMEEEKKSLLNSHPDSYRDSSIHSLILIGPEGDFSKEEIELAAQYNFIPVSLGATRLRSETAGVVAAVLLRHI